MRTAIWSLAAVCSRSVYEGKRPLAGQSRVNPVAMGHCCAVKRCRVPPFPKVSICRRAHLVDGVTALQVPDCIPRMQAWIEEMGVFVKSLDSNHLLTVGAEGFWGPVSRQPVPTHDWHPSRGSDLLLAPSRWCCWNCRADC